MLPTLLEALAVVAIVAVVTILVITIVPRLGDTPPASLPGRLAVNATAVHPSATFWAVGAHAPRFANSTLSRALNATPITMFRFGAGGDDTNVSAGLTYLPNGSSEKIGNAFSDFLTFCRWRACHAIFTVPGEINDPGAAAVTVRYVEQTLGVHPDYWSIGNEPEGWTHYGIAWTSWRGTDDSIPTPQAYAVTVQKYVAAMRSVDPSVRVIGIQSADGGVAAAAWMTPLVALNGPNLSAVAYHSYPASLAPEDGSVQQFLTNGFAKGFPDDYTTVVREVRTACPGCRIPVFVDEYNGAAAGVDQPYVPTYADVPLVAAAAARALALNVSQFSFFDLEGVGSLAPFGLLGPTGSPRPTYYLYSEIFHNLSTDAVRNATVLGGPPDVAAIVGTDPLTTSLFVVNANPTTALELNVTGSGLPVNGPATIWSWSSTQPLPSVTVSGIGPMPSTWTIPPEGILLVNFVP